MFLMLYYLYHRNIPLKDPTNIPDPYVKLYLLPGRAKDSKRKTAVRHSINKDFNFFVYLTIMNVFLGY